jgi:hypothetical protein
MSESPVKIERRGPVGLLTIDRADRRNALSRETLFALGRLGRELVADASVRAFQRAAMQWAYIVRNRRRWAGRDALVRDQADDAQKLLQRHFQVGRADLGAVAQARVAQVAIPFRTETEGWENRLFPWEFVLSAATRPSPQAQPLTMMRQLVPHGSTAGVARPPRTVLYVEAGPDGVAGVPF